MRSARCRAIVLPNGEHMPASIGDEQGARVRAQRVGVTRGAMSLSWRAHVRGARYCAALRARRRGPGPVPSACCCPRCEVHRTSLMVINEASVCAGPQAGAGADRPCSPNIAYETDHRGHRTHDFVMILWRMIAQRMMLWARRRGPRSTDCVPQATLNAHDIAGQRNISGLDPASRRRRRGPGATDHVSQATLNAAPQAGAETDRPCSPSDAKRA